MVDVAALPKVELHCHYDGVVDPALLRGLPDGGVSFPVSAEELEAALPVRGYADFERWFALADASRADLDVFVPILHAHVERLRAQNVRYAEIFTSMPRGDVDPVGDMRAFIEQSDSALW